MQKPVELVPISPPPPEQRVRRDAVFAPEGVKRTRYSLPTGLQSSSPVGYRTRISLTRAETQEALRLLSLQRPTAFVPGASLTDEALFEESSLGVLSARQSTNFRGHRQITLGPQDSKLAAERLRTLDVEAPVLDGATHTHIVLTRPYRTPFTLLLTFIGHPPIASLLTVPIRAWRKRFHHADDIPTIGYLQQLHVGVLADAMERAAVLASEGRRRAQIFMKPFTGRKPHPELEALAGLTDSDRRAGWQIALVAQVGVAIADERVDIRATTCRKVGANLMAFRSERIQPGVNQEEKAPAPYQSRQDMDVPEELVVMAGRAAYNAFAHWTHCDRERSKDLLLLERVDVLSPNGKTRLREIRKQLADVTDQVVRRIPKWIDWPTGRAFSRNANRGRKAFALAGQRIYIVGLSRQEMDDENIDWDLAVRAVGAACARGALVGELLGATEIPEGCDLLGGICLMAGPVNQNDIGKSFYGGTDLLAGAFPDRDPTALLVWTLKAKTVADPIGNEEQLMSEARKGALVDLRPGPHDAISIRVNGSLRPFRQRDGQTSEARAYADQDNFVTDPKGTEIPGNRGRPWPFSDELLWT
jgi:hypothetical protein